MISAVLRDGGTDALLVRDVAPGMDRLRWRELNLEEDWPGELLGRLNDGMRRTDQEVTLAPWPRPLPRLAPLDYTPRHEGLVWRLWQRHQAVPTSESVDASWGAVPAGDAQIVADPTVTDRTQAHASRLANPEELRANPALDPTVWLRLPFDNETGGCALKEGLVLKWNSLHNCAFTLSLDDNDVFVPFDLRYQDRYSWVDDDGKPLDPRTVWNTIADRAALRLYLRPRRWKWFAKVIAHYEIDTIFESALNDEVFLAVYWDRPPFYPVRHDVRHTAANRSLWHEYEAAYLSWDDGVNSAWQLSRHIGEMRYQMVQQQYYSLCYAYTLIGAEPAVISIWRTPPLFAEVVLGIGRVRDATGIEQRVWAVQQVGLDAEYPQTLIGQFWGDFDI